MILRIIQIKRLGTTVAGYPLAIALLAVLLSVIHPVQVVAELKIDAAPLDASSALQRFCGTISQRWLAGDHAAMAELVAADGVRIAIGPVRGRDNLYSSNQAFYFFKNLFQSAETESFRFVKVPEDGGGGLVNGMAEWLHRRAGSEEITEVRLVFSLTHSTTGWGLAGIRAVR